VVFVVKGIARLASVMVGRRAEA
ncbi:MAG: hypothetical protein RLZZ165_1252, partial [Bacteroidota bacterium]